MNCSDISSILTTLENQYGWRCRPVPGRPDVVEVSTGRRLIDGEPVRLLVRLDGGDVIVASDGGRSLLRLRDAGFDVDDSLLTSLWEEALRTYRVSELDDRVFVQAPVGRAGEALARLADTVVALDGLQVVAVPKQVKGSTLASEVETYLRTRPRLSNVRKSPGIKVRQGLTVRPSLSVASETRGEILIQAGATSSKNQAFDHAFATFGLIERAGIPMPSRLTILGGQPASWTAGRLRALSEVTFVGFWEHRAQIISFLEEEVPNDPVLVPPGIDVPMVFG